MNFKDTPSHISVESLRFYLSRIFEFFPKPVYSTIVAEKFQIYGVRITGKYICESKNWIYSFLLMPTSKTLPQVFIIILQTEGNCPFLPNNVFFFFFFFFFFLFFILRRYKFLIYKFTNSTMNIIHTLRYFFLSRKGGRGLWSWKKYQN